jgi:hypothetical protein
MDKSRIAASYKDLLEEYAKLRTQNAFLQRALIEVRQKIHSNHQGTRNNQTIVGGREIAPRGGKTHIRTVGRFSNAQ